jgi:CheY-like chemotaxis protein
LAEGGRLVILVVDDHPDTAYVLCRLLGRKGYPTHCVDNGLEAIDFLKTRTPRLIVLDVQMPGMTGLEVLDVMSRDERLRKIPVLVYSAANDKAQSDLALRLGAKAYMVKGTVGISEILTLVAQHATPETSAA